jgi:2-dehydropantoate 2-reductase
MARVAVIGVGAIGAVFAAHLLQTRRHEVTLYNRRPSTGLKVVTPQGVLEESVNVASEPVGRIPHDWVFLATKTTQTADADRFLGAVCGPDTRVVILQNGVEAFDRLSPYARGAKIVPTVVRCPAERLPGGTVIYRGVAALVVPNGAEGLGIEELFRGSSAQITCSRDIDTELWKKLCTNVAAGSVTAITGRTMSVLRLPSITELVRSLVSECAFVASAEGSFLGDQEQSLVIENMMQQPPDATTSMMRARMAGEELEHDAITGAVLRAAARHDLQVPVTTVVHALLEAISGHVLQRPGPSLLTMEA